jgi:hypothetical protein
LRLVNATTAHRLTKAGFQIKPKEFDLPETATSAHEQEIAARFAIEETSNAASERLAQLEPFMNALRQRVTSVLRAAPQSTDSPDTEERSKLSELVPLLVAVAAELPYLHEISSKLPALTSLAQNRGNHSNPATVDTALSEIAAELQPVLTGIQERLAKFPYPFPHARGSLTAAEYARSEKQTAHELERTFLESNAHVDRLFALHYRLVGQILALSDSAEKVVDNSEAFKLPNV